MVFATWQSHESCGGWTAKGYGIGITMILSQISQVLLVKVEALGIILRLRVGFDLAWQWNGVYLTCNYTVTEAVYLRPC